MNEADDLASAEYREHEKYVKFFTLKALHTVVQSRSGFNTKTSCDANAKGRDWFNVALMDCESTSNLQNAVREKFGKKVPALSSNPISIDIVFKNHLEDNYIILESWCINVDSCKRDVRVKNHFSVYNRFSVLLRSVISISRILPSYHLSRRQDQEFKLFWRLNSTVYEVNENELHNNIEIGSVCTPVGTVKIKVLYRNKIESTDFVSAISYKSSDRSKLFPLIQHSKISQTTFASVPMLENEIASAVSDTELSNGFSKIQFSSSINSIDETKICNVQMSMNTSLYENTAGSVIPAFADVLCKDLPGLELPELSCSPPFLSLLKNEELDGEDAITDTLKNIKVPKSVEKTSIEMPKHAEAVGFEDDFVLVELRPAFCSENDSLGCLYKEWKNPVPLDLFATLEQEDSESEKFDITSEIEKYKADLEECRSYFLNLN